MNFKNVCELCLTGGQPPHGDQGDSAHFPFHPLLPFMVTTATPAGRHWVLTYRTDPYYPELLPTKPLPIPMPHNTLSSWLHQAIKNWAAISLVRLLRACSLGTVNLPESALSIKPPCFVIWLQFGLPISIDLTCYISNIKDTYRNTVKYVPCTSDCQPSNSLWTQTVSSDFFVACQTLERESWWSDSSGRESS
jgi:hypothetical protein